MADEENRKRVLQHDDIGAAISSKRAALGTPFDNNSSVESKLFFKLLCPQSVTGLIIGKGGSVINQLNVSTGAKIKLSQNNEFFPGTNDRVLVLCGTREAIANALSELVTRIAEAPEKKPNAVTFDSFGNPVPAGQGQGNAAGNFQIKLIIPKIASGTLIGKGGVVIKHMANQTGCKMQLGDEADPFNTNERQFIVTSSTVPSLVHGAQSVMVQLMSEQKVRTYDNTTCAYNAGGMPYQPHQSANMMPMSNNGNRSHGGAHQQHHQQQPIAMNPQQQQQFMMMQQQYPQNHMMGMNMMGTAPMMGGMMMPHQASAVVNPPQGMMVNPSGAATATTGAATNMMGMMGSAAQSTNTTPSSSSNGIIQVPQQPHQQQGGKSAVAQQQQMYGMQQVAYQQQPLYAQMQQPSPMQQMVPQQQQQNQMMPQLQQQYAMNMVPTAAGSQGMYGGVVPMQQLMHQQQQPQQQMGQQSQYLSMGSAGVTNGQIPMYNTYNAGGGKKQ